MSQPNFDEYGQIIPDTPPGGSSPAWRGGDGFKPAPPPVFNEFGELISLSPQATPPPQYQFQPPFSPPPEVAVPVRRQSKAIYGVLAGLILVIILAAGGLSWIIWLNPAANNSAANPTGAVPTGGASPALVTLAEMDKFYTTGKTALASERFKDAATNFEQLRDKQRQIGFTRYSDGSLLLFRSYVGVAQELTIASNQLSDLEQSLNYFKKAEQLEPEIPSAQRDQPREALVKQQIEYGELYYQGRTALEGGRLDEAIEALGKLYAKTQSFKDVPAVYYNALTAQGDALFKAKRLEEAYSYYAIASRLTNVPDNNAYAKLRLSSIGDQLKKAGKPVPTSRATPSATK